MGFKSSSLLCLALVLAVSSATQAFDITKILSQYPEFSTFSKYLTETKLTEQINSRNTITVLAVDNSAISAISGKSADAIKAVVSTHIVLDFFDEKKLMEALGSKQQLTTLYQASGLAVNQQGFLKVALIGEGEVAFGSAVNGAATDAELVKTVTSQPYNISVLQVSKPIVFPGADKASPSQGAAKAPVPAQGAKAPVPAKGAKAPVAAQGAKAPAPSADKVVATSPSSDVAETPVDAPAASSPLASGPASGPDAADAAAPSSASSTTKVGLVGAVMAFASVLVVL